MAIARVLASSSLRRVSARAPAAAAAAVPCRLAGLAQPAAAAFADRGARFATSDSKQKALDAALSQVEKSFGRGTVMRLGESVTRDGIKVISTGSLTVDVALGIGGLPRGRFVEIYGPESSGKTTLALQVIAEAQKKDLKCFFVDVEHAIDTTYARALGVNVDDLLLSQPDTGEQALEVADTMLRSGAVDVIVVDSVAALVPRAELEGDMGDSHMALQARLMSQALRKMAGNIGKTDTLFIFINQIRSKVGVIFGSPEVTAGGNSLKYYSSVRLDIRRTGQVKQGDEITASSTRVKVVKNKLAPPFRTAEFDMTYGGGVSRSGEFVDLGLRAGLVTRAGAWFSLDTDACRAEIDEPAAADEAKAEPAEEEAPAKPARKRRARKTAAADPEASDAADARASDAATGSDTDAKAAPGGPSTGVIGIGQGREKAKQWLEDPANAADVDLLERAIRALGRRGGLDLRDKRKAKADA